MKKAVIITLIVALSSFFVIACGPPEDIEQLPEEDMMEEDIDGDF